MRLGTALLANERVFYVAALCSIGLAIAWVIGFLQSNAPLGDDGILPVGTIQDLASNFPFLSWDPHLFGGYVPIIGLSWLAYLLPAVLVRSGQDAISTFHAGFMVAFLLYGVSVYYFARSLGSERIVSLCMPILAWSTNSYWNLTIWGGAYDRAFTIPWVFIALGATYRYASLLNSGGLYRRDYWLSVSTWSLVFLGDVFIVLAGVLLGLIFLFLSGGTGNPAAGLKRIGAVFIPPIGLTLWQTVPLLNQALAYGPYRVQDLVPNEWNQLILPGAKWVSTLNLVYLPTLLSVAILCALFRTRFSTTQRALLFSLIIMGTYWFVMGWVPFLWPYLPRAMTPYSSVENLSWILLITIPLLFTVLHGHLATIGKQILQIRQGPRFSITKRRFLEILEVALLLAVAINALVIIPSITPANFQPLTDQLNAIMNHSLGPPTSDYRVSLQNRLLTRFFPYYQGDRYDTGGRVILLNPDPLYNSWYSTEAFYKNDISAIKTIYIDDRPVANVSSYLESPRNFAGETFWLDWYATYAVIFDDYTTVQTINNYTSRPYLYTVATANTNYGVPEVVAGVQNASAILEATNATIVGFYSASVNSPTEYDSLTSLLASMGLGPKFIIPLYLHTIGDVTTAPVDVLVTDSNTYTEYGSEMQPLLQATSIVVVSSVEGPIDSQPSTTQVGRRVLVNIPISFSQLVDGHEQGSYDFARASQIVRTRSFNATSAAYQGPIDASVSSSSWFPGYTLNSQGVLQSQSNTLILNLTNTNTTERSQYNIQSHLPGLIPLSSNLTINLLVEANANITLGVALLSPRTCCPDYVAVDQNIPAATPVQLSIPYSGLNEWRNLTTTFGFTRDLVLAVNLAPGNPKVTVRISNASISSPEYTIFTLPEPITPAESGILTHDSDTNGIGLLNGSNGSTTILTLSSNKPQSVTTIASLSGGMAGEEYDKIITVGKSGQMPPMITLFAQPSSSLVHEDWANNQNMIASSIPLGYRGLVWKETYSNLWRFGTRANSRAGPLTFYDAGPGMIYIPLSNYTNITASYNSLTIESIGLYSSPFLTVGALVILRKDLPNSRRKQDQKVA